MIGGKAAATQNFDRSSSVDAGWPEVPECCFRETEGELAPYKSLSDIPWPKVSVVIPTLNEARNLPHVFSRLPAALHEVIIVDGHSVDDTVAAARRLRPDVRVVKQTRSGKGNALACGFAAATGDVIAMVDADGSADPGEIPQFVKALLDGADFAKGTRFAAGGGSSDITRLRRLGNRFLSGLVNTLCRTKYSDLCYGYNVFWCRHVPVFGLDTESPVPADGTRLWGDGFEIETLINIRIAQAGLTVAEVGSYEHPRIHGVSNLNAFSDGWRVLRTILVERFYYSGRRGSVSQTGFQRRPAGSSVSTRTGQPPLGVWRLRGQPQPHPALPLWPCRIGYPEGDTASSIPVFCRSLAYNYVTLIRATARAQCAGDSRRHLCRRGLVDLGRSPDAAGTA